MAYLRDHILDIFCFVLVLFKIYLIVLLKFNYFCVIFCYLKSPLCHVLHRCLTGVEIREDAHFSSNGYLEFSKNMLPHNKEHLDEVIGLELSTNQSEGLIFWHGQRPNEDGQGKDYIYLASE